MPVTFHSPAHGDVLMLDQHARYLIELMGHSDQVPGALDSSDVPGARQQLRESLNQLDSADEASDTAAEDEDEEASDEASIDWHRRAWPLLQMLDAAADAESHVLWY